MAKRRLTKRQQWRIQKIQEERAARAARKEQSIADLAAAGELGPEQQGLVIAHYGQQLDVEALEGERAGSICRCFVRANIDSLVTGDRVIWRPGKNEAGVIVARCDRQNLLQRPDNFGALKPVAANIDHIILVIAPEPEPHDNLIDRYLVASESTGIPAVILLNKTDLITDRNRAAIDDLLARYQALGYPVIPDLGGGIRRPAGTGSAHTGAGTNQRIRGPVRRGQVINHPDPAAGRSHPRRRGLRKHPQGHPYHHHRAPVPSALGRGPDRLSRDP